MDITQKINTYYIVLFALIPGITIGVSKLLQYIFNDEESKAIKYMNIIATLGIITAILVVLNSIKEFLEFVDSLNRAGDRIKYNESSVEIDL